MPSSEIDHSTPSDFSISRVLGLTQCSDGQIPLGRLPKTSSILSRASSVCNFASKPALKSIGKSSANVFLIPLISNNIGNIG